MRVLYGLGDNLPPFAGLTPGEIGERLRELGCDGVFLKHLEPQWVEALGASGLKVFASFGVFVNRGEDSDDLWQCWPDSRPITADGAPAPQQEWYRPLRPTHGQVRALRLAQFSDLVTALPLDGVWLDFIRWPARWEQAQPQLYHSSFDPHTLEQFARDCAVDLPDDVLADPVRAADWLLANVAYAWFTWRCEQIETFVAAVRERLRRHRPDALLGAFTVPWTGTTLDQLDVEQAHIRIVGQDPARLAQQVDVLSPMVYHRLCGRSVEWVGAVTQSVQHGAEHGEGNVQVWPVVEAIESANQYPADEFIQACRAALTASADGLIVFKLDGFLDDPAKVEPWRTMGGI